MSSFPTAERGQTGILQDSLVSELKLAIVFPGFCAALLEFLLDWMGSLPV